MVHDIIGQARDLFGVLFGRAQSSKGTDGSHVVNVMLLSIVYYTTFVPLIVKRKSSYLPDSGIVCHVIRAQRGQFIEKSGCKAAG